MIIGVGIDILEIEHLKKIIAFEKEKFLNYAFTDKEIKYANKTWRLENLAPTITAKEACCKDISQHSQEICLKEIEILRNEFGKPQINLLGNLSKKFPSNKFHFFLSSSFNSKCAISFVIVEKN